jgi:nucleoside-diphosphate-sugar epimerase
MTSIKQALVVGASGIIGSAVVEALMADPQWHVRASRRSLNPDVAAIDFDLTNAASTLAALADTSDITHVFYAAYRPDSNALIEARTNAAMLRHVLDALKSAGAKVQRVVLYQGAKVYGGHLGGPVPTPFYEDATRHLAANLYFSQEDVLRERQLAGELEWSILRPDTVLGEIAGNPMNIAIVIGAYAALCREAGVALKFPGSPYTYRQVYAQLTDARWLGRASLWAATADNARNEAFNLVGEPFRWNYLWKKLADALGMEIDEPQPISMSTHMADQADAWQRLVERYDLQPMPYERLVNWGFGDFVFNLQQDLLSDMGKIRRAGFTEPMNTEEALLGTLARLRAKRLLP